jgi:antibiotic biosynthesis monooxygenase (ABM) superfamily enzyme
MSTTEPHDESVTIVVRRRAKPGKEKEFEAWVEGITNAAAQFEGYLGTSVIKPAVPGQEYVTIFRFDTYDHLRAWHDSDIRAEWVVQQSKLIEGEATFHKISGMHYWFDLSDVVETSTPARWKMALIITLALYPLGILLGWMFEPISGAFHPLVLRIVILGVAVALMTWFIMPALTHVLRGWLFED